MSAFLGLSSFVLGLLSASYYLQSEQLRAFVVSCTGIASGVRSDKAVHA